MKYLDSAINPYIQDKNDLKQKNKGIDEMTGNNSQKSLKSNGIEKVRDACNPSFQINMQFLKLFFIEFFIVFVILTNAQYLYGIIYLLTSTTNFNHFSLNTFTLSPDSFPVHLLQNWEILMAIDLCINLLLTKPIQNATQNTSVYLLKDYFYNLESREYFEHFFKNFFYRAIIYIIVAFLFEQAPTIYHSLFIIILVTINALFIGFLIAYAIVIWLRMITANLIDNYMAGGESYKFITSIRRESDKLITSMRPNVVKSRDITLKEIDKLLLAINNPNRLKLGEYTLPKSYRSKIAYTLSFIRNKIDILQVNAKTEEINVYKSAEKELATRLYEDLRNDRCIICYRQLDTASPTQLVVCPRCGSGGHKEHIKEWFDTGKNYCPVCRTGVGKEQFLLLDVVSV